MGESQAGPKENAPLNDDRGTFVSDENVGISYSTFKNCLLAAVVSRKIGVVMQGCSVETGKQVLTSHARIFFNLYQHPADVFRAEMFVPVVAGINEGKYPYGIYMEGRSRAPVFLLAPITLFGYTTPKNVFTGYLAAVAGGNFNMLQGTGIRMGGGEATISGSKFRQWGRAVRLTGVPATTFRHNLSANQFFRNQTAIEIETPAGSTMLDLNLQCNEFDPGERLDANSGFIQANYKRWDIPRMEAVYGIFGLEGSGLVGIVGRLDMLANPIAYKAGANIWPTTTPKIRFSGREDQDVHSSPVNPTDLTFNWRSPVRWKSFEMREQRGRGQNPNPLVDYRRFKNEFLGYQNPDIINDLDYRMATVDVRPARENLERGVTPLDEDPNCGNLADYNTVFPRSKQGGDPTARIGKDSDANLVECWPNPTGGDLNIAYSLEKEFTTGSVQIFSILTGQQLQSKAIASKTGRVIFTLSGFSTGMYGYRLVLDGAPIKIGKFILNK